MYTEKALQIFKNPKHMGEIKNPDGLGKVGNPVCGDVMHVYIKVGKNKKGEEIIKDIKIKTFGCLPPEEKIVVSSGGWQEIESIPINESVINDLGKETKVIKKYEINYDGPILKFTPFVSPFNSFYVTPEHPILCIKRKRLNKTKSQLPNSKWLRVDEKEILSTKPEYIDARHIEEGDYLIFSYNNKKEDNKIYTKELLRLIGYYLSEGYIIANESAVAFSFNKKEKNLINEAKNLIKKITGKECSQRTRGNVTEVYVCSKKFVRLLRSFAGKYAKNKKLSPSLMLLPPKKQMEIISTFFLGDGDYTKRRPYNTPTIRLATASMDLAIQFQEILARNEIFASIVKRKRMPHKIEGRDVTGSDLYIISYKLIKRHKFVKKSSKTFLVPVKKIEKGKFKGTVYNLHVNSSPPSYLVRGFSVHNCVAAIATSSVMADLVKGKTLKEAKKLTKKDIIDELGSLPPVKYHCSVLSTDGLKKAIEEYEKKLAGPC